MRDQELILRFFALYENLPGYKPPISQYLNEYMRAHRNSERPATSVGVFKDTMASIASIFGGDAFNGFHEGKVSSSLNRAMFDAVSLTFAFADRPVAESLAVDVRSAHEELLQDPEFQPLIGRATANRSRMHGRVQRYSEKLMNAGVRVNLPALPPGE